jgi:hypothetical protein
MSKDGPPSGRRRYGGLEAFRSGLPPEAANPRRPRTDAEIEKAKNLVDFTDHFGRLKSFDKPIPATQGISKHRANALKRREELEQHERDGNSISLINGKITKRLLFWSHGSEIRKYWFIVERDTITGKTQRSKRYFSREGALLAHNTEQITWQRVEYT